MLDVNLHLNDRGPVAPHWELAKCLERLERLFYCSLSFGFVYLAQSQSFLWGPILFEFPMLLHQFLALGYFCPHFPTPGSSFVASVTLSEEGRPANMG